MDAGRLAAACAALVMALALEGCGRKNAYDTAEKSENGFIDVAMPGYAKDDTVFIFAPPNCPREAGQRARALHEELKGRDIPAVMTSSYSLSFTDSSDEFKAKLKRTEAVMNGELPIVLVNGMGKANPTAAEAAAEYQRTARR